MRSLTYLGVVSMLSCLALGLTRAEPIRGAANAPDEVTSSDEPPLVSWSELAQHPCQWLGRRVRIRMQVQARMADWNPYLTRFGTGQFQAIQGWADEQYPWIESEFDTPQVRVFARRDARADRELRDVKSYSRFEMRGVVREVFLDLPWIEIDDARSMTDAISEATVIHAARAIELMKQNAWRLADLELEQALGGPLPDPAMIELQRLRDTCRSNEAEASEPEAKKKR